MLNVSDLNNSIEFKGVSKAYPEESGSALTDVNFTVKKGEFVSIIGPSGCGKSTILHIIAGLEKPTLGTVIKPDTVGMVFQTGALFPWLTAKENVALALRAKGANQVKADREALAFLEAVSLSALADKRPVELSGGQRQRVGIARALSVNPSVLLLDEPFSALDEKTTAELHADLYKIWKDTKRTIVMVSHIIEEAVSLAERIILMKQGKIQEIFTVSAPYPRREQQAIFMQYVEQVRKAFFA